MQVQRGKYQTRTNRIVEITGSKIVPRHQPGSPNPVPTRMWEGMLLQMDGKTPESIFMWTDAGGFYGTAQGVASQHDLNNLILAAEPQTETTNVVDIADGRAAIARFHKDLTDYPRVAVKLTDLVDGAYGHLMGLAEVEHLGPDETFMVDQEVPKVTVLLSEFPDLAELWRELIAATLVAILERKP
jgi:hypothetical protein